MNLEIAGMLAVFIVVDEWARSYAWSQCSSDRLNGAAGGLSSASEPAGTSLKWRQQNIERQSQVLGLLDFCMGGRTMGKRKSFVKRILAICALLALTCFAALRASGEDKKVWQPGTLIQARARQVTSGENEGTKQYDISVQVGSKIYVASHTLKDGEPDLEYYVGMARMVLIEGETLTFNDLLGHSHSLHIISEKDAPAAPAR